MFQIKYIEEHLCKCGEPIFKLSIFILILIQLWVILKIDFNQVDQQREEIFDNWKKPAIMDFNISDQCKTNEVNINYTIPKIGNQCSCQEGYYDQICRDDQIYNLDCVDVDEFDSKIITKWVFVLMDSFMGLKMCSGSSNIQSYYNQIKKNECFADQQLQAYPISNIKIVRKFYQTKQILLANSIILDRDINDPIVDIEIIYQNDLDDKLLKNQYSILDSYKVKQVWDVNGISFKDQQNHPHIYKQINYTLVTQKYIKLNQNCSCSNKMYNIQIISFGLFDQLDQTAYYIKLILYIQIGMTGVVLINNCICFKHAFLQLFFQLLLSGSYVYLYFIYLINYDENMTSIKICFDNYQIHNSLIQDMFWYLISIYALNSIHILYLIYRTYSQCRERLKRQNNIQLQSNSTIQSNGQQNNPNKDKRSNDINSEIINDEHIEPIVSQQIIRSQGD